MGLTPGVLRQDEFEQQVPPAGHTAGPGRSHIAKAAHPPITEFNYWNSYS